MNQNRSTGRIARLKEIVLLVSIGIFIGVLVSYLLSNQKSTNGYIVDGVPVFADGDNKVEMLVGEMLKAEEDLQEREFVLLYSSTKRPLYYLSKIEPYYLPLAIARQLIVESEQLVLQNHVNQAKHKLLQALSVLQAGQLFSDPISKNQIVDLCSKIKETIHDIELEPAHAVLDLNALLIDNDILLLKDD